MKQGPANAGADLVFKLLIFLNVGWWFCIHLVYCVFFSALLRFVPEGSASLTLPASQPYINYRI